MYQNFNWTWISQQRNRLLKQYEPIQLFLFYEFAKALNVETVIDVGANTGAYSIVASSLLNVKTVHAFEPTPITFEELKKNIALNEHAKTKTTIYKKAVSSAAGNATLGIVNNYSGANSLINTSIHNPAAITDRITVELITLDGLFNFQSKTLGLKIDVEGHEAEVLIGAKNILRNNKAIVQLEDYAARDGKILSILGAFGYERILVIGPDCYFTNARESLDDKAILRICEEAARDLIEDNLNNRTTESSERPIRINLFYGLTFELSGAIAAFARRVRTVLRR